MLRRLLCLLFVSLAGLLAEDAAFWGVVQTQDHSGSITRSVVGLSTASNAPELKALKEAAETAFADAKAAWDERRKAWEADSANRGKSFRTVEPEPRKPVVKLDGSAFSSKADADALLAKRQQEDVFKRDPGLEWRRKLIAERLLQYFSIGVEAPASWHLEQQQKHGSRFACNMQYLSHVVDQPGDVEGANTWFFKYNGAESCIKEAQQAGIIAWFTWYGLAEAPPARYQPGPAQATPVNAKVQSTMIAYWSLLKKFLQLSARYPDVPVVLQIEPDEWGHLLLSTGAMDPHKPGTILVGGSGLEELKGLPDTVAGWAKGFRLLRDLYAPRVILCANPSAWDRNNSMSGAAWVKIFQACGVTADQGWDLFIAQLHDWDSGLRSNGGNAAWPPYTADRIPTLVSRYGTWEVMCSWIQEIHQGTGMWGVCWQLPVGNATYAACDGSDGHGMDGLAEALLDNPKDYRLARMFAQSGCCMWIFSGGSGTATRVFDRMKDGITNPAPYPGNKGLQSIYPDDDGGYLRLKGAEYFRNPVPILGKPVAKKGSKSTGGDAAEEKTPAAAPVARPAATLVKPEMQVSQTRRLLARLQEELASGRRPVFTHRGMKKDLVVHAIDAKQVLEVRVPGAGTMTMPWSQLKTGDLLGLALSLTRDSDADDQAMTAFFLYLDGQQGKADERIARAGAAGAAVREAFGLK